jgi:hypothetical protein
VSNNFKENKYILCSKHICSLLFTQAETGYANKKIYADPASNCRATEIIINLLKFQLIELINFQEVSNYSLKQFVIIVYSRRTFNPHM